jgi:cytochrome c-type biogenesis protein CcmF
MTSEPAPVALGRLVRRNRRRYGGYIVHAGVAVALIGVAASTSFQHSRTATLKPGQSVRLDGYRIRYLRPTASANAEKISLGAVLAVSSGSHRVALLHTSYGLYPSLDTTQGPIGRFFNGSDETQVGLKAGALQDIWTDINPNVTPLQGLIANGNSIVQQAIEKVLTLPAAQRGRALSTIYQLRDAAILALTQRYVTHPWAAQFLFIVSPLVTWLWAGAILAALGGLIALWPLPPRRNRRRRVPLRPSDDRVAQAPPVRAPELV